MHCRSRVPRGVSGFCECAQGRVVSRISCDDPGHFTCEERCNA
jgi:hypothetical protein